MNSGEGKKQAEREERLRHVRGIGERGLQDQAGYRLPGREVYGHRSAQRLPEEDQLVGGAASFVPPPVICCTGVPIEPFLEWLALALSVAAIIDNEHLGPGFVEHA